VRVIPIRVFEHRLETSVAHIAYAIRLAAELGADVINLSLGTVRREGAAMLYESCMAANQLGSIVVSAGLPHALSYPAVFDNVIGVLASDFSSRLGFSYWPVIVYEFLACGRRQPVVWRGGAIEHKAGDSIAAANLAGIVARCREIAPRANVAGVRAILGQYSTPPPRMRRSADAVPAALPPASLRPAQSLGVQGGHAAATLASPAMEVNHTKPDTEHAGPLGRTNL
jgi:hypothetical protein